MQTAALFQGDAGVEIHMPHFALSVESIAATRESPLQQAASVDDSAAFSHAGGNHRRAETLCLRALELIKLQEGPDHPDAAVVLGALGEIYRALGRFPEAKRSFQPALRFAESFAVSEQGSKAAAGARSSPAPAAALGRSPARQ